MRRVAPVFAACLLVAACTGQEESAATPDPRSEPHVSSTPPTPGRSSRVEQQFRQREALPSCGTLDLLPRGVERATLREKGGCLTDASPRVGAELTVITYTEEGDPVRQYFRKEPRGYGYVVFIDGTDDSFGTPGWSVHDCDGLVFTGGNVHCVVE